MQGEQEQESEKIQHTFAYRLDEKKNTLRAKTHFVQGLKFGCTNWRKASYFVWINFSAYI